MCCISFYWYLCWALGLHLLTCPMPRTGSYLAILGITSKSLLPSWAWGLVFVVWVYSDVSEFCKILEYLKNFYLKLFIFSFVQFMVEKANSYCLGFWWFIFKRDNRNAIGSFCNQGSRVILKLMTCFLHICDRVCLCLLPLNRCSGALSISERKSPPPPSYLARLLRAACTLYV